MGGCIMYTKEKVSVMIKNRNDSIGHTRKENQTDSSRHNEYLVVIIPYFLRGNGNIYACNVFVQGKQQTIPSY